MRVISGKYKRSNLVGFNIEGTRPTMDRVKESLFALIQNKVKGSRCLDLFAGSGALGIEALSNGAKSCYFVDLNDKAINVLSQNINRLKLEEDHFILKKDYKDALKYFCNNDIKFDLIFLDPPYKRGFLNETIDLILKYKLLEKNGQIICEFDDGNINNDFLTCIKEKKYGDKYIKIFEERN